MIEDIARLAYFSVSCKGCGGRAVAEVSSNEACGDPECCGERVEYVHLVCPACGIREMVG